MGLQVDILNTQSHNDRLTATLKLLNEELKDKEKIIEKCETDIRRRNDDIGKQTREVDKLNRKYEKLTADMEVELHCSGLPKFQRKEMPAYDMHQSTHMRISLRTVILLTDCPHAASTT